ncbi:hypothetical protein BCR44DRAFT_1292051 [Catenaria anguillulae PL171]|uniref:Uncharacterized protein n=1 Tax=Catenaria anguillulae PL171 TaxID=765915 RepID=A0A1Y2H808_9FUNG|nr:hypothetical protein BCR44DRAFT_1292051 [Catenaria anguillulae PL171]
MVVVNGDQASARSGTAEKKTETVLVDRMVRRRGCQCRKAIIRSITHVLHWVAFDKVSEGQRNTAYNFRTVPGQGSKAAGQAASCDWPFRGALRSSGMLSVLIMGMAWATFKLVTDFSRHVSTPLARPSEHQGLVPGLQSSGRPLTSAAAIHGYARVM